MKLGGIILAAGASSRMRRDKALLRYADATFLNHILHDLQERLYPVVIVLGHHADVIRKSILPKTTTATDPEGVKIVVNSHYHHGMLSSLQTGIDALPKHIEAAMFTLVDHPTVKNLTLDKLLATYRKTGASLVIPRNKNRNGHPVVADRSVLNEITKLPLTASPKDVIRAHRINTTFIDVNDTGIIADIDTPEEYAKLVKTDIDNSVTT